ncbi:SDR family NAD(P)-dependent oxidoreductase [Rathayibacter sp. VKM Ac-2835]|uniref:SDR family NAD(P)-dependent oxidoreductase n=1 Tax=Rathayibacter sp. VKM Ac-2835 TaxID=2739043 RepID=UPI0015655FAD|nr:SDR family NAD(P)-dependent oxidoreductase [Rathayibacter sp. VKM Ac-2835]
MSAPGLEPCRVAVVTGANHGIGAAIAERLAADGLAVLVAFLAEELPEHEPERQRLAHRTDGEQVAERIRAAGGRARAVSADLRDAASAALLLDAAEESLGPVDVLVHNATGSIVDTFRARARDWMGRPQRRVDAASIDRVLDIDARAGALLIAELAERLERRGGHGGRIVTLTSGGERGFPGEVSYGAAKAALVNYTISASLELSPLGVTANAVHPPVTDTGWVTDDVHAAVAANDAFFDVARPDEVADLVSYLVSPAGRRVTGNVLRMA